MHLLRAVLNIVGNVPAQSESSQSILVHYFSLINCQLPMVVVTTLASSSRTTAILIVSVTHSE